MAATFDQVAADVLALTATERARIRDLIDDSAGDAGDDNPLSPEWQAEVKRRMKEIDNGVPTFSAAEVLAELERKYP